MQKGASLFAELTDAGSNLKELKPQVYLGAEKRSLGGDFLTLYTALQHPNQEELKRCVIIN